MRVSRKAKFSLRALPATQFELAKLVSYTKTNITFNKIFSSFAEVYVSLHTRIVKIGDVHV